MNRRRLLQLSLLSALAPATGFAAPAKVGSPKKGIGIGAKGEWKEKLSALDCKWFYSWGASAPADVPAGISFAPMVWGHPGQIAKVPEIGAAAKAAGRKELLGFNEPDQKNQANLSVETALDAWPKLMETGLRLGSPGCVHPDREWMKAFMAGVKKRKLRVDFVCVHSYGNDNADGLVKRLEAVHKLYGKPIWITEFAVGDWSAKKVAENRYKPKAVLKFMENALRQLKRLDCVERYAWFPAGPDNAALGTSALFDAQGKLTELGECYRDF